MVLKYHKEISNYCEEFDKNLYRSRHSQQNLDLFFNSLDSDCISKTDEMRQKSEEIKIFLRRSIS